MQINHKQLLKTLIKANVKGELPETLNSLSSNIKGRSTEFLRTWNLYLCRYIRTKQQSKAKQILQIMQKILHVCICQMSDPYIPILISNNGASISQSQWNFTQAESHLQAMLEYIDSCTDKILDQEEPVFARAAQLKRLQIKVRLQLAGVYSQLQKHQKAIVMADSSVRLVYQFCINIKMNLNNNSQYQSNNPNPNSNVISSKSKQKIQFIINSSEPQKVINNAGLQKVRQQLCAWKQNSQLSSIHLRKLIQSNKSKGSLLSNFQIGDIMQVTSMMSYQLPSQQTLMDLVVIQQLQQLIIYLSVGYFTLGTQLYYQKSKKDIKKNGIDKYKDIFQNQYKKQQLFHLQAVTLAARTIGFQSPYVQHLIKVFNDNYNGLQIIEQTLKQESNSSIRMDDFKIEQTPIKYLMAASHKKIQQKQQLNDSLFDLSVDKKVKKKPDEAMKNKRNHMLSVKESSINK